MYLNENQKEQISKEIENLEKLSSAELVAVIAKRSSNYKYVSLIISIFLVFSTSFILFFIKFSILFLIILIQLFFTGMCSDVP